MTWTEIRAHYAALYARAQAGGTTQKVIAARGGITGQNNVSRLLSNDRRGPSVEIFVHAVEGLGLSLSQFFAEMEGYVANSAAAAAAAPSEERPIHHGDSSLSGALTQNDPARLDQQQIRTIIHAATEGILARLDRIDARMAQLDAIDGDVPTQTAAARTGHFG
jgi:transcriptional regulator with XRE-family HTH domain